MKPGYVASLLVCSGSLREHLLFGHESDRCVRDMDWTLCPCAVTIICAAVGLAIYRQQGIFHKALNSGWVWNMIHLLFNFTIFSRVQLTAHNCIIVVFWATCYRYSSSSRASLIFKRGTCGSWGTLSHYYYCVCSSPRKRWSVSCEACLSDVYTHRM